MQGAACVTAWLALPILMFPLRLLLPPLAVYVKLAVPLPVPLLPVVSQLVASLLALHGM